MALLVLLVALAPVASPTYSAFSRQRQHPATSVAKAVFDCASRSVSGLGLEAFYRLGESPGATVAADSSGRGLNGTYNGGVTLGAAPVNAVSDANTAASFSAASKQYVESGGPFSFTGTASHSITLWFRSPAISSSAALPQVLSQLQRDAGGNLTGWAVVHVSSQVQLVRYDAGTLVASVAVPVTPAMEQVWQHYAFTYDGATLRAYLNGALAASTATTGAIPAVTTPARIGGLSGAPGAETAGWLQGEVDDVAIWSRVLPPAEVRSLGRPTCTYVSVVDRTPGLLSHWAMDDTSGSTFADRGPANVPCPFGGVTLGTRSGLPSGSGTSATGGGSTTTNCGQAHPFTGTAPFSVEGWLSMASWSAPALVASKAGKDTGWAVQMMDSQFPAFSRGAVTLTGSTMVPKDDAWHHIVATYDGATMRLYVDGNPAGSLASTASVPSTTNPLQVMSKGGSDNTSIYNRALTPAEVAAHWDAR